MKNLPEFRVEDARNAKDFPLSPTLRPSRPLREAAFLSQRGASLLLTLVVIAGNKPLIHAHGR